MTDSIAVQVIKEQIRKADESFMFWATREDNDSFNDKMAQEKLSQKIMLQILLKEVIKAEQNQPSRQDY